jgi:thioredoxin reductase
MYDPVFWMAISGAGLAGLTITVFAALSGWRSWLELQRMALQQRIGEPRGDQADMRAAPSSGARIEIADLKERVRKLEAIAAGVDI